MHGISRLEIPTFLFILSFRSSVKLYLHSLICLRSTVLNYMITYGDKFTFTFNVTVQEMAPALSQYVNEQQTYYLYVTMETQWQ
jgi:hypothetical protein